MTIKRNLMSKTTLLALTLMLSPLFSTASSHDNQSRGIEVTFTKWLIDSSGLTPPQFGPLLEGFTAGDIPGDFEGSVIQVVSQKLPDGSDIKRLEARYTVIANNPRHSFSALVHGQQSSSLHGLLRGTITDGWRSGAEVHVEFQGSPCGHGNGTCLVGTIRILPERNDD